MTRLATTLLSQIRRKDISRTVFRQHAYNLSLCLAQQAAEHLAVKTIHIQTPLGTAQGNAIADQLVLVPILRSGLVLLPAFIEFFGEASIGCLGMKRDEKTAIAHLYYQNLPKISGSEQIIVLDPMIATGGSATDALTILSKLCIQQERILFVAVIASQEGINKVKTAFPKVTILVTAIDPELNSTKFIVPGLGDFGDRFFGTE